MKSGRKALSLSTGSSCIDSVSCPGRNLVFDSALSVHGQPLVVDEVHSIPILEYDFSCGKKIK
ncbi:MAG: hypothetical protein D3906_07860 [Candidatus Electrothrix sp. AUS1_2]|nr:hypothetical protein [Candidatus Electrothrix sp. AUS1_2]